MKHENKSVRTDGSSPAKRRRLTKNSKKLIVILSLALVVLIAATIAVFAALRDTTATVTETLETAEVSCTVNSDWSVTNTSNIPVLIRVRVIVNMTDDEGNIIPGDAPDYTVGSDWTRDGDYLYYNGIVSDEDGENVTTPAISYTASSDGGDRVTVLAEAIQATSDAAEDSWGLQYADGAWS